MNKGMWKRVAAYGAALAAGALALQWLDYDRLAWSRPGEIYTALIAAAFLALGVFLGMRVFAAPKPAPFDGNPKAVASLGSVGTGQAATCWVVRDGALLFTSNAGSANLSGIRIGTHGSLTLLGQTATDAGTVDAAVSDGGRFLYVQTGATGAVDAFAVHADGSLTAVGAVLVPGAVGAEGIVAA